MKTIQNADLKYKTVFLRADFNVPIKDGIITDNNRIKAVIPTIKYLVGERAKIIIGTHLGRPEGKESADTSIAPIAKELQRILNLKVVMAPGIADPATKKLAESLQPGGILVLENLRWNPGEETNDTLFAQSLAEMAEVYVNDAFAVSHRANASVEAITKFLPSYAGILLENEIVNLSKLNNPSRPFVIIIGGIKVDDKAKMIRNLEPKASEILLGGGVANTFLKAKGANIGDSVYDESMIDFCKEIMEKFKDKVVVPIDWVREEKDDSSKVLDIGEKTARLYCEQIKKAKTVFWNGNLGYTEDAKYQEGTRAIAKAMNEVNGLSVIAGGDTAGFVNENGLNKNISFISTGGGAALEFLAGEKLPGIEALK